MIFHQCHSWKVEGEHFSKKKLLDELMHLNAIYNFWTIDNSYFRSCCKLNMKTVKPCFIYFSHVYMLRVLYSCSIIYNKVYLRKGFLGDSDGKESACNAGDQCLIPEPGSSLLEEEMVTHSSVLVHGEFHGPRSLVGFSPWDHEESEMTEWLTHSSLRKMGKTVCIEWYLNGQLCKRYAKKFSENRRRNWTCSHMCFCLKTYL